MIDSHSLCRLTRRTLEMLTITPADSPLGIQLVGKDAKYVLEAMDVLRKYKYDILDLNAACPVRKVASKGQGASLLKDPKKLQELLGQMVKHSDVPVTAKIRLGFSDAKNAVDIALSVQDAGVSAVTVHGRTAKQGYTGSVDYQAIRKIKKALNIPVVGSGDVFTAELAKKMFDETGCDLVALARGALGNPWIFKEVWEYLKKGKTAPKPDASEVINVMKKHLDLYIDFWGETRGVVRFRTFVVWYTRGFDNIRPLRNIMSTAKTRQHMFELIDQLRDRTRINCDPQLLRQEP